jgi:Universal stress protein UspA and related nucleotide-binding proteins
MKLLVPVNFTPHSGAAVRFAIQWAAQQPVAITYLHVLNIKHPGKFDDSFYKQYYQDEMAAHHQKLEAFVKDIYSQCGAVTGNVSFQVKEGAVPYETIMAYCNEHPSIEGVVVSTAGGGMVNQLLAVNTKAFVQHSEVPVFVVPKNYKNNPIGNILYITDLRCYEEEIRTVIHFARELKANVQVLHFSEFDEIRNNEKLIEKALTTLHNDGIQFRISVPDPGLSFSNNVQAYIDQWKPSLLMMFTEQGRSLFERLMNPSKSQELTFNTSVPLMIGKKPLHQH